MIEMRYMAPDAKSCEMFCPECEQQFGVRVALKIDFSDRSAPARKERQQRVSRFEAIHEKHEEEPSRAYQQLENQVLHLREDLERRGHNANAALMDFLTCGGSGPNEDPQNR